MDYSYIITPLIGGVIGYITNDIAIRMLFRPHTAKYIWGIHIPFTPGIIPKEKGRIAEAIGGVISENFINKDVLGRYLLSEDMISKLRLAIEDYIEVQKRNDETLHEYLSHYLSEDEIQRIKQGINDNLSGQLCCKLSDGSLGDAIAKMAMTHIASKLNNDGASELLAGLGGAFGGIGGATAALFGGNLVSKLLSMLREPTETFLSKHINSMMQQHGNAMIEKLLSDEMDSLQKTPVSKLLENKDEQLKQIVDMVMTVYTTIINDHLPKILESIDISKVIRERINEMDIAETEKLIFQVMNKELKAIVWLGALLGLLMGGINCFIM